MEEDNIIKPPEEDNELSAIIGKLYTLKKSIEFEINTTYEELGLIKNPGFAVAILTILITYFAYSSINSIISYATRAYLLFAFLLLLVPFGLARKVKANKRTIKTKADKLNIKQYIYKYELSMQVFMPLLSSFVIIYFGLFILHVYGLHYSSVGITLSTVFNLNPTANFFYANFFYAISVITAIPALILYLFKRDSKIVVPSMFLLDVSLIQLTSISMIIYSLLGNYPFWFSYQLLLALIIVGLAYFALAQYTSSVAPKAKLTGYKNALSITKAKLEYVLINKKDYNLEDLSDICEQLEVEFSDVEKPKLIYVPKLPLFLDIYATLDMKEEAEVYFDIREENRSAINKI